MFSLMKKSVFEQVLAAPSFGRGKVDVNPRYRVQKPVYKSVPEFMLMVNNHPELVRPVTQFDTDPNYLSEEERLYLDKMEMYDRMVARMPQDFGHVNNSVSIDSEEPPVPGDEITPGEEVETPENQ